MTLTTETIEWNEQFCKARDAFQEGRSFMIGGRAGCLSGDTLIDTPRNLHLFPKGIPLKNLVGQQPWVYCWVNGTITLRQASRVWRSKENVPVIRVRLSASTGRNQFGVVFAVGKTKQGMCIPPLEIVGTPDHPVLLSDGKTWKTLGELVPGDHFCSMYRRAFFRGIKSESVLIWTGIRPGTKIREARFIVSEIHGPRGKKYHVHHANHDNMDHQVENLQWLTGSEHNSHHATERNLKKDFGWQKYGIERHPKGMLGKNHTKKIKTQISQTLRQKYATGELTHFVSEETKKKMSASYKAQHELLQVNHTVLSVESAGFMDVYDMEVPESGNFVANGVVVHNCGKSRLATELLKMNARSVTVSPTGRASIIARGSTIHSFFGIRAGETLGDIRNILSRMREDKREVIQSVGTLIFDEISMVRADLLDLADRILRDLREDQPFGGAQVVFVGDMFQLPPVLTRDESVAFYTHYDSPYFFSSQVVKNMFMAGNFEFIELLKVYRQSTDLEFVTVLNKIREGTTTWDDLRWLNSQCTGRAPSDHALTLTATRRVSDEINQGEFGKLLEDPNGPPVRTYVGKLNTPGSYQTEKDLPAPQNLDLVPGCRVMLCANTNRAEGLVNGQLGTVLECLPSSVRVKFDHLPYDVTIFAYEWEFSKLVIDPGDRTLRSLPAGTYSQIPLILAFSVTIHKGQGGTFDEVHLPLRDAMFSSGQAYVALSRTRTLVGLTLGRALVAGNVKHDPILKQFYEVLKGGQS